jgi:hypothetical protein
MTFEQFHQNSLGTGAKEADAPPDASGSLGTTPMNLPVRSILALAATVGCASLLRLAACIVILATAILTMTSCADAIDAYCDANCMDPAGPTALVNVYRDDCVATLEGAEHEAERTSCDGVFQTYFRCQQQSGEDACGLGGACPDEVNALATCLAKNDPDNVCARGLEHFNACDPAHAQPTYVPGICAGHIECSYYCMLEATCDDITGTGDNDLTRCATACTFAQSLGVLSTFEGD